MKKQLASVLPRLMAMSNEAKKEGMENTPQYQRKGEVQPDADPGPATAAKAAGSGRQGSGGRRSRSIYKDHPEMFEQYSVDRVFVPRMKQVEPEAKEG